MPEGRPRTNFEPGMIFTLDHLKKEDLQFDIDAETARFREKKNVEMKPAEPVRPPSAPKSPRFEQDLK